MTVDPNIIGLVTAICVVCGVVIAVYRAGPERTALSAESLKAGTEILSRALEQQQRDLQLANAERQVLTLQVAKQAEQIAELQSKTDITPVLAAIEAQGLILADIGRGIAKLVEALVSGTSGKV